jgi:hypothetical protein
MLIRKDAQFQSRMAWQCYDKYQDDGIEHH